MGRRHLQRRASAAQAALVEPDRWRVRARRPPGRCVRAVRAGSSRARPRRSGPAARGPRTRSTAHAHDSTDYRTRECKLYAVEGQINT